MLFLLLLIKDTTPTPWCLFNCCVCIFLYYFSLFIYPNPDWGFYLIWWLPLLRAWPIVWCRCHRDCRRRCRGPHKWRLGSTRGNGNLCSVCWYAWLVILLSTWRGCLCFISWVVVLVNCWRQVLLTCEFGKWQAEDLYKLKIWFSLQVL